VPLNHDLNHRFFVVWRLVCPRWCLAIQAWWASTIEELEPMVLRLFVEPEHLLAIPVAPPPYWGLKELLKAAFAPSGFATGRPWGACLAEPPTAKGRNWGVGDTRCGVANRCTSVGLVGFAGCRGRVGRRVRFG
jgi:hypothetical protein